MNEAHDNANSAGHIWGLRTKPYRSYVLTTLLVIYILNFVDRGLLFISSSVI